MAWKNIPLVIQDSPVGYQTINQIRDNAEFIRTTFTVEHGTGEEYEEALTSNVPQHQGTKHNSIGKHTLPTVAKTVIQVETTTAIEGYSDNKTLYTTKHSWRWSDSEFVKNVKRVSPGVYEVHFAGLSPYAWVEANPSWGETRLQSGYLSGEEGWRVVNADVVHTVGDTPVNVIRVNCWEYRFWAGENDGVDANKWWPADFAFVLSIFST